MAILVRTVAPGVLRPAEQRAGPRHPATGAAVVLLIRATVRAPRRRATAAAGTALAPLPCGAIIGAGVDPAAFRPSNAPNCGA